MGTRAGAAIRVFSVVVLFLVAASCSPRQRAPAHAPGLAFDADTIDVTVDWQAPSPPSLEARAASLALTATDGSGLELQRIEARAVVYGPLAFTELHVVFHNPEPREREGTFSIVLPDGAALSRFAMRQDTGWQEGEIVEREQARAVYESFVHRNVDPALLEHDGGNVFRGKVFPIRRSSSKEIIVAYTEELTAADQPYRLPLRGLGAVGRVDVQLLVPSLKKAYVLHREAWTPDRDFLFVPGPGAAEAVRGGRLLVTRAPRPASTGGASSSIDSLAVLIDSSASRAPTYAADLERVAKLVGSLGAKSVSYTCFDQEIAPAASLEEAAKRKPRGASDLGAALRSLRRGGAKRALLVTDGIASAGARETRDLAAEIASLRAAGIERVDAVEVGSEHDTATLRALVTAGLPNDGVVIGAGELDKAASILRRPPISSELVFSDVASSRSGLVIDDAPAELVERAFAQATIRRLRAERSHPGIGAADSEAKKAEIVKLATRYRLLTEFTSMLVLETENDYARFNLPRSALRDILVVGSRGVELLPHGMPVFTGPAASGLALPGSPLRDSDGDGIPDDVDRCPNEPETFNGVADEDGCPDVGRIRIDSQSIRILPVIHFSGAGSQITPESFPVLDEVAAAMKAEPRLELVGIFGHTDDRGSREANQRLSEARARAVRDALVARGVPSSRLVAKGLGGEFPIDDNATPEGRAKNRRVEFNVVVMDGVRNENIFTSRLGRDTAMKRVAHGPPLGGDLAAVDALLADKQPSEALRKAEAWRASAPEDILAAIAEGRSLEALGRYSEAARAYGSILDLASRPEHRRAAAAWLEALAAKHPPALEIAIDAYRRAAADRPEQPSSHRLLAWALARGGHLDEALVTIEGALARTFDPRFSNAVGVLRADAEILGEALASGKSASERQTIESRVARSGGARLATSPSTRLVLTWETDESDLDLWAVAPRDVLLATPANVRRGYGPELVTVPTAASFPLQLEVHMVARGPGGHAIGKVAVVHHDGRGKLTFDDRPFVLMNERAAVALGAVTAPK